MHELHGRTVAVVPISSSMLVQQVLLLVLPIAAEVAQPFVDIEVARETSESVLLVSNL